MNSTTAVHLTPNKKPPQCHFWLKAACKNGGACQYSHDGAVTTPQSMISTPDIVEISVATASVSCRDAFATPIKYAR